MAASLESPLQASAATSIAKLDTSTLLLLGFPSPILLPAIGCLCKGECLAKKVKGFESPFDEFDCTLKNRK
ncbi:hypothetical protein BVRB_4g075710 isoform A [Beta vulgaris subsp. vulgaris]|uniref:Uncharacterized protein n=1 Tax=Beta vulgaris subsp. vulgaris TaxID=3555 RepID=A0A0J8CQD4_BETVV|nr:hypothetical protein BVRB_4g075710 isoform A [Beta vulgaris subsp. vulgaris]